MGLDAKVYCDCFEKGRLRTAPLAEWDVYVDKDGSRSARTHHLEEDLVFDHWNFGACEHEFGILLHHRIGNIAAVELIYSILFESQQLFPIIMSKIVYDGTHGGDFIPADQVALLEPELRTLSKLHCDDSMSEEWIRHFEKQLQELVEIALRVGKPISF